MTLNAQFAASLSALCPAAPCTALGLAVSGGGDSMALLHLAHDWAKEQDVRLHVATVNHNLRPEAASEAAFVAETCTALGLPHNTLDWTGWDGTGNLQQQAREARRTRLAAWARKEGLSAVALGHTKDDLAETFLMRIARGSGLDGLTAMSPRLNYNGVPFVRPLLDMRRAILRDYLKSLNQSWIDDPSNEDPRFDRVKIRQAMPTLAEIGLDADRLADTATALRAPRAVLDQEVLNCARAHIRESECAALRISYEALRAILPEITRRILGSAIRYLSNSSYSPRQSAILRLSDDIFLQKRASLGGCLFHPAGDSVLITREPSAMPESLNFSALYDGRWQVTGPDNNTGLSLRPLGEDGLALCPDWREQAIPRTELAASPAIWHKDDLIAAPFAGKNAGYSLRRVGGFHEWLKATLSH